MNTTALEQVNNLIQRLRSDEPADEETMAKGLEMLSTPGFLDSLRGDLAKSANADEDESDEDEDFEDEDDADEDETDEDESDEEYEDEDSEDEDESDEDDADDEDAEDEDDETLEKGSRKLRVPNINYANGGAVLSDEEFKAGVNASQPGDGFVDRRHSKRRVRSAAAQPGGLKKSLVQDEEDEMVFDAIPALQTIAKSFDALATEVGSLRKEVAALRKGAIAPAKPKKAASDSEDTVLQKSIADKLEEMMGLVQRAATNADAALEAVNRRPSSPHPRGVRKSVGAPAVTMTKALGLIEKGLNSQKIAPDAAARAFRMVEAAGRGTSGQSVEEAFEQYAPEVYRDYVGANGTV